MHSKRIELVILLYLLSAFCVPSSLGIYKNNAATDGSVITASWNVALNQNNVNNSISVIVGGSDVAYTLNVESTSQVDVEYAITISNIPSGVVVKLDNEVNYRIPSNGTVTINPAGTILYSSASHQKSHTIYFKANNGATVVSNQSINIDVDFKQA